MENLFALENVGRNQVSVKIIEINRQSQESIDFVSDFRKEDYKSNAIDFDGSYKPDEDESLKIDNFDMPNEIIEAVTNPLGVERLVTDADENLNVRALFIPLMSGNEDEIIFQRIPKRQILQSQQWTLVWDQDTFLPTKKPGVVVSEDIHAYYESGTLYFKSYYWANQIFNLNKYYREATNDDIIEFCSFECFYIDDLESIIPEVNIWTRRKIAYILDTQVLQKNSAERIIQSADKLGLDFEVNEDNKIIFPKDKSEQKELLSYLADEIYKGNLTEDVYLTNSKRPL